MSEIKLIKILFPVSIAIRFLENTLCVGECFDGVNII